MSATQSPMPEHSNFHAPWSQELAAWYAENHGEHSSNRQTIQQAGLQPNDWLLDIGCGSGAAIREAGCYITTGEALGVDLSPAMVDIARKKTADHPAASRLYFQEGSAMNLPLPENSRTVVVAIHSIHHWEDVRAGLAEVARVLREDGRLIICEEILSQEEQKNRATFTPDQTRKLLIECGFQPQETKTLPTEDGQIYIIKALACDP